MYTAWARLTCKHSGKDRGTIERGKLADLVVIDRDYLTCPEDQIRQIETSNERLWGDARRTRLKASYCFCFGLVILGTRRVYSTVSVALSIFSEPFSSSASSYSTPSPALFPRPRLIGRRHVTTGPSLRRISFVPVRSTSPPVNAGPLRCARVFAGY